MLITILGSSLAFMDGSIVNVALPTLQRAFQVTLTGSYRASVCNCHSFRSGNVCIKTNSKSRFMRRAGTASPMGLQDANPRGVGDGLLLALLLLLHFPFRLVAILLLLRMMYRASGIRADLVNGADIVTAPSDVQTIETAIRQITTVYRNAQINARGLRRP